MDCLPTPLVKIIESYFSDILSFDDVMHFQKETLHVKKILWYLLEQPENFAKNAIDIINQNSNIVTINLNTILKYLINVFEESKIRDMFRALPEDKSFVTRDDIRELAVKALFKHNKYYIQHLHEYFIYHTNYSFSSDADNILIPIIERNDLEAYKIIIPYSYSRHIQLQIPKAIELKRYEMLKIILTWYSILPEYITNWLRLSGDERIIAMITTLR